MNRTSLIASGALSVVLGMALADNPALADEAYSLRQYLSVRGALTPMISPSGKDVAFLTDITGVTQLWKISNKSGWPDQLIRP